MEPNRTSEEVLTELRAIWKQVFGAKKELGDADSNVFGAGTGVSPRDFVYFINAVELKWKINFEPKDYDNKNFYTLTGMSRIIQEKGM